MAIILGETGRNDICLRLGKQGEHDVTFFEFDFSLWAEKYGDGVLSLRLTPNGSATAYPVTLDFDGTIATFTVTATDTATAGLGSAELVYIVGDDEKLKKSVSYVTSVEPSDDTGEAPEPYDEWLARLEVLAGETSQAKTDAETAAGNASASEQAAATSEQNAKTSEENAEEYADRIADLTVSAHEATGDEPTVTKTIVNEVYNLDFGLVPGKDGRDGADGVGIASVVLNSDYTLTITLTDGRTYTTTSIRGEQGETGLTPDFTIGTVTTLEPGSQATATITGTDEEPVLNLGIPKGDTGEVSMDDFLKVAVTDTASGSGVVTIPDGANLPMKSLKVTLTPQQDATPWIGTDHDTTPYLHRAMPTQSNDYNRESGVIVGGTVAWNQFIPIPNIDTITRNGVTCTNNLDGTVTFNGTATADTQFIVSTGGGTSANPSHKYLLCGCPSNGSVSTFYQYDGYSHVDTGKGYVGTLNLLRSYFLIRNGVTVTNLVLKPQLFDLTAMFGSTIADYIYSLEQATAGSGIAWLKSYGFLTEDYIPYSQPTLQSVQATAHKTYDADGNVLGNYALDSSLTLRGIPKLDASNNLYYDGDTYASDGTVNGRFYQLDLDGVTTGKKVTAVTLDSNSGLYYCRVNLNPNLAKGNTTTDIVATRFEVGGFALGKCYITAGGGLFCFVIQDQTITTVEQANNWLASNPFSIVYELATPTTEPAQAYTNPQIVDPDGTEEYVTANYVPVGHDSTYSLVCPISGYDSVSAVISPTTTASDGQTYTADLGQTVYGGTVDLVSGEVVVDRAMVDLGTLSWLNSSSVDHVFYADVNNFEYQTSYAERRTGFLCSTFPPSSGVVLGGDMDDNSLLRSDGKIYIRKTSDTVYTIGATVNGVQLVYNLATPQTIQLTPQEIRTILGANNVWSNGSNTYIKYVADTRLFILKVTQ